MKAVLLNSPKTIGIKDVEPPSRKEGQALIKVKAAGICGSDISAYRGVNPLVSYPRIIGHEVAGEIIEIDENSKNLKVGDHVILDPYIYCGKCYPCSLGRTNCCEDLKVIGVHIDGGMQEYVSYPSNMIVPVPKTIPWELVPLAEPVTIALHSIHRARLKKGEHIAINGAGAIGILTALCAISYGAIPVLIDVVNERLELAKSLGVEKTINVSEQDLLETLKEMTNGRMAEVVVEASGANSAIRNTIEMASYAGRIALVGWPNKETPFPTDKITKKELDIYGSRTSAGEFEEAIELITGGKVNVKGILSKVISIEEVPQTVIELSEHPERYVKVTALF